MTTITTTPRLFLVRHCQASGQEPEALLTEAGSRQAVVLAEFLAAYPIAAIVASPYRRAQQSVAPLAGRLGLGVRIDHRLNERTLSPRPIPNWREVVRDSFDDPDLRAPGGESAREVQERGWNCLNDLLNGDCRLPVAVTHGNLMSLILHSLNPAFGYAGWENLSNPDVYALHTGPDGRLGHRRLWNSDV